jgi:phytoene dehydrogenase-like protein
MERYDVAIIGAGVEGLIAATLLSRARLRIVLLDRETRAGGRCQTLEFHPGFKASPYTDELPEIPARLFWEFDLARRGVLMAPRAASACVSDDGISMLFADEERDGIPVLHRDVGSVLQAIDARLQAPAQPPSRRSFFSFARRPRSAPWPGEDWGDHSLAAHLGGRISDPALRLHIAADAVSGRAASPFLTGTALHLLAPGRGRSGLVAGGLGALGAALWAIAANSGTVIRCGAEVETIEVLDGRARSAVLKGGEKVEGRAVLSTLDVKRTFLDLVPRAEIKDGFARLNRYRMAGQTARVLFALGAQPGFAAPLDAPNLRSGPIHVAASAEAISAAYDSWQAGQVPSAPLVTLRVPSAVDPNLAPPGKAVMTATISAVPYRLSEGAWTPEKRDSLVRLALAAAERAAPGIAGRVLASRVFVAPDIEESLGITNGDLDGGDVAPDQVLGYRPFGDGGAAWVESWRDARTPLAGLYLGGSSTQATPFFTGVAGGRAARTILADLETGRLK